MLVQDINELAKFGIGLSAPRLGIGKNAGSQKTQKQKKNEAVTADKIDGCCGWLRNPSRTTLKVLDTMTFVGIYRGIIRNQGFLGGAGFRPSTVWMAMMLVRRESLDDFPCL